MISNKITLIFTLLIMNLNGFSAMLTPVTSFEGGNISVTCRSGNQFFASTLKGGVFFSLDFGKSWNRIPGDPTGGVPIITMAATQNTLFVGGNLFLFRYEIASGKWSEVWQNLQSIYLSPYNLKKIVADQNTVAALTNGTVLYISTDEGISWTNNTMLINSQSTGLKDLILRGKTLYGTRLDSLYQSSDFGVTWQAVLAEQLNTNKNRIFVGEHYLWSVNGQGLSRCNWDQLLPGIKPVWSNCVCGNIPLNRMDFSGVFEKNGNLWITTLGAIYLSKNLGDDFSILPNPEGKDIGILTSPIESNSGILVGSSIMGIIAADINQSTSTSNLGLRTNSVSDLIFYHGKIHTIISGLGRFTSKNLGDTWETQSQSLNNGFPSDKFILIEDKLFLLEGNKILEYNESENFFVTKTVWPNVTGEITGFSTLNGHSYMSIDRQGIYVSKDTGKVWNPIIDYNSGYAHFNKLAVNQSEKFLFFISQSNGLSQLYKRDIETNKIPPFSPIGNQNINDFCLRSDSLFVACTNGIYLSLDFGISWKNLNVYDSTLTPPDFLKITKSGDLLIAISRRSIAYSKNNGVAWDTVPKIGALATSVIKVAENQLMIGTDGNSIWNYYLYGGPTHISYNMQKRNHFNKILENRIGTFGQANFENKLFNLNGQVAIDQINSFDKPGKKSKINLVPMDAHE